MRTTRLMTVLVLAVGMLACSGSDSAQQRALAETTAERDALESELAETIAERDALQAAADAAMQRRERAEAVIGEIVMLLEDPTSFGTEEEVADLLGAHAADGALMDDDVFGAVPYRTGFYNTLYAGAMDAEIDPYDTWVAPDGSQGGVLWMWHGENLAGNQFELAGISLIEFDEDGQIAYELVTYPYSDAHVLQAVRGSG